MGPSRDIPPLRGPGVTMGLNLHRQAALAAEFLLIFLAGCSVDTFFPDRGPAARLSLGSSFLSSRYPNPIEKVAEKLRLHQELEDSAITVAGREGRVVLLGTTPTKVERAIAIRLARDTEGVTSVDCRIKVDPLTPPQPLTTHPLSRQRNDIYLMLTLSKSVSTVEELEVTLKDSSFILSGKAPSPFVRDKAGHLARSCARGMAVQNNIIINLAP